MVPGAMLDFGGLRFAGREMNMLKKSVVKTGKNFGKGKSKVPSTKKVGQGVKNQSMKAGHSYIGETEKNL
jgi:hypothetical protein